MVHKLASTLLVALFISYFFYSCSSQKNHSAMDIGVDAELFLGDSIDFFFYSFSDTLLIFELKNNLSDTVLFYLPHGNIILKNCSCNANETNLLSSEPMTDSLRLLVSDWPTCALEAEVYEYSLLTIPPDFSRQVTFLPSENLLENLKVYDKIKFVTEPYSSNPPLVSEMTSHPFIYQRFETPCYVKTESWKICD